MIIVSIHSVLQVTSRYITASLEKDSMMWVKSPGMDTKWEESTDRIMEGQREEWTDGQSDTKEMLGGGKGFFGGEGVEIMRGRRKVGISNDSGEEGGGGVQQRELSGTEKALGLGDCCAFILLCSRLLKPYLRKRLSNKQGGDCSALIC